ncbi:MAG: dihydrolipoyl dehydrogenase [Burkholderiaceae bacterium]|jgi:dihydrolipoamide dehydrogenase|nr:dihydrolipoyl dehydrogenase [Burkholderiaceae bacterium]
MSETIQVKVPNIGDFAEVEIIELLVAEGDTVAAEQSLITVESDKASMEIPSSAGGVVAKLLVKLGDKVSEGTPILELRAEQGATAQVQASQQPQALAQSQPSQPSQPSPGAPAAPLRAAAKSGPADVDCALLVLGSGPGGYAAAFRAADLGLDTVLVERYSTLGGVCLNVGCIPSKALLHVASLIDEAKHLASIGVGFGEPKIDLDALRAHKDRVVGKLTGGVASMAKGRKVRVVRGYGRFLDANRIEVEPTEGGESKRQVIRFEQAIVAAGSSAARLPFLPDDPRIVDSTGALALAFVPKRMLVIGGGIIGLEMATVYSTLGARIDVVEMLDALMPGADREAVKVWQRHNAQRFDRVMLQTKTVAAEATADGIRVSFEGANAPAQPQLYDLVLCAVGRTPNGGRIDADKAGIDVDERGFVRLVDRQMRTSAAHIFAIGDVVGQPMLAHKATHEGHVAAEAAAGQKSFFDARVIPSVAYTDPEIAWVGLTEEEAQAQGVKITKASFPWTASGRALANGRAEGFTKLLFDEETHRIVGGSIVGTNAGDLIGEIALAIEMGADATDIGRTIHPHPTLGETIGLAAEFAEGTCTDLMPPRRR